MKPPLKDVLKGESRIIGVVMPVLAFLLGLNLPRSFSILALICAVGLILFRSDLKCLAHDQVARLSMLLLVLFGLSYSVRQLQLEVWVLNRKTIADAATYTLLPSACFALGWLWRQRRRAFQSGLVLLVGFALGGLVYVSLGLLISRQPWWNLSEIFPLSITVPWGDNGMAGQNVRSVEQRAYAALAFLPVVPWLILSKPASWQVKVLGCLGLGSWGVYVIWSLHSPKLMAFVLFIALLPCLLVLHGVRARLITLSSLALIIAWLVHTKRLCDERLPMHLAFLRQIQDHPWGGRQIRFSFEGCPGQGLMVFAPPPNSPHLPHNIFLDQVNDVGILPAVLLLAACSLLYVTLMRGFLLAMQTGTWSPALALRWGVLSCILTQSLFQPFLYSDRLLFCLTFVFTGSVVAEFAVDPDHRSRQSLVSDSHS